MPMTPVINRRPVVFLAVALLCGTALGGALGTSLVYALIVACTALALGALFAAKKKYLLLAVAVAFALGTLLSSAVLYSRDTPEKTYDNSVLSGRVVSSEADDGAAEYLLEDVTCDNTALKGVTLVHADVGFCVGDVITANAYGKALNLDPFDGYSMSYYFDNIKYEFTATAAMKTDETPLTASEKIQAKVKDIITENLGEGSDKSGIAIALLSGNKSSISKETLQNMQISGVSHVFTVSGLHVMSLAGAIYGLLRLLKVNRKAAHVAVLALLLLYASIIGFRAGVTRAIIMLAAATLCELTERPRDPLTALSLAAIIITLFSPLSLFTLGFQMSFAALLGIIMFYKPISSLSAKVRFKPLRYVINAAALTVSANAFLVLISASVFGTLGAYFVIANAVLVPLASLVDVMLFGSVLICAIIPNLGILFAPIGYLISAFIAICNFISTLPYASVTVAMPAASAVIFAIALTVLSRFVRINKYKKLSCASVLAAVATTLCILV